LINNTVQPMTIGTASAGSFKLPAASTVQMYQLGIGHQVWNADYSKVATITNLTWDGTDYVITHDANITFTSGEVLSSNPLRRVVAEGNVYRKAGFVVQQDFYKLRNGGPLFEELDGRKVFRGRPFLNTSAIPLPFVGRAQKLTVMCRAPNASGVRWDMTAKDDSTLAVPVFEGQTPAAGNFVIIDLIAGTTTFVGAGWTSTSGLSAPWAGRLYDIAFRIRTAGGGAPTYASFADTPAFEVILDGVTGLGG
jgi:hypothetical protein